MRLSLFNLDPRVRNILESNHLDEGYDLLYSLELYRFVSRERIVEICQPDFPSLRIIDKNSYDNTGLSMEEELRKISTEFDVIAYQTGSDSVLVCSEMTKVLDINRIELLLSAQKVKFVTVTPMNYLELKGVFERTYSSFILMQRYILQAMNVGATDIHMGVKHSKSGVPEYFVSFRVGNDLEECDLFKIDRALNSKLVTDLIDSKTTTYSGDLDTIHGVVASVTDIFGDGKVTLRLCADKVVGGYHCVGRIQKFSTVSFKIHELGFPEEVQRDLTLTARKLNGLTFITGGFRTGKNTTMFAMANDMVERPLALLDITHPVEVLMPFPQIDYGGEAISLLAAVKNVKKKDVDAVFINELPAKEVAEAAMDLVNSSVHVLTTFHLNRVWHLPHKMYEFFGEDFSNLFSQINMCATQKMFPLLCENCKTTSVRGTEFLPEEYKTILLKHNIHTFSESKGCSVCKDELYVMKVQPYIERVVFDDELVGQLSSCSTRYEMEMVLKRRVMETGTLDRFICEAIGRGDIHYSALDSLL